MEANQRLHKSASGMSTGTSRNKPLNIPQATMDFLMLITQPAALSHEASHAAFIKNAVLADIRLTIQRCDQKGGY